jgi:hypothetical protein
MRHARKVCKACGAEKTLRSFYRGKGYADGHMSKCKRCHIKAVNENRELKEDHYRELRRRIDSRQEYRQRRAAYARSERGRESHRRTCRRYYRIKRLIRDGVIVRSYRRSEVRA